MPTANVHDPDAQFLAHASVTRKAVHAPTSSSLGGSAGGGTFGRPGGIASGLKPRGGAATGHPRHSSARRPNSSARVVPSAATTGHQGGLPSTGGHVQSHTGGKPKTTPPRPATHGGHVVTTHKPKAGSTVFAHPTPKAPPTKPAPVAAATPTTATNSQAPESGVPVSGGLDLGSILPILLIAGAALALFYLYSHRKGSR